MSARIGSLFSGYGGLDLGVMAALGGSVAWHLEYDKAPSKILAHHWPDVPNYGDVTKVDWSTVEPVDIITGGSPCQDLSHAGKRKGMTEGTRSNLWVAMREAIAQLRPGLVVWENVRGAYSAAADSEVEPCPGCVGDRPAVSLRALGRVLGDLSDLGYDCRWHGLRAADVGAPHGRFRVFVVAHARGVGRLGWPRLIGDGREAAERSEASGHSGDGSASLLPTPTASDTNGAGQHGDGGLDLRTAVASLACPYCGEPRNARRGCGNCISGPLLPTPTTQGGANNAGPSQFDRNSLPLNAAVTLLPTPVCDPDTGNGHARNLGKEARLIPTPLNSDAGPRGGTTGFGLRDWSRANPSTDWGIYADAIARWEHLTRPAPAPTQPSKKGTPQLSPAFSEWLMGLPEGHVTGVPGLSRNDMLKALGNGVVPQQAAAALRFLLALEVAA